MAEDQQRELVAFFAFLNTFTLVRPVLAISDLSDGGPFYDVLQLADLQYFRQPANTSSQPADNWVLRFSALKRLYRLMTQYLTDVQQRSSNSLDVPDLQAMAKDYNLTATLEMCRLTIAIAIHSEMNKETVERIQRLSEDHQNSLMKAIEQTMRAMKPIDSSPDLQKSGSMNDDDHYYQLQSERSRILSEKSTLESVYTSLLEEHRTLQTNYDDAVAEKEDALTRLRDVTRELEGHRNDRTDGMWRAEIDRLRSELQTSEDNLGVAEAELERHHSLVSDLQRKVEELQARADEAAKLKDQVDEYRHAAERLQKTENVMEKYKKKLEESADLRRRIKALEEQNASLVDKNASLEEEYRKVSTFKPLLESYKYQISELETKASARSREIDSLKFELDQTRTLLKISSEERAKDSEALELYQERVKELELASTRPVSKAVARPELSPQPTDGFAEGELLGQVDDDDVGRGLGGELDDALSGRTMTDLKLEIRKLKRELEQAKTNQADNSRILMLENLLDDANRMKARYEADYLAAHREKLVLQRDLEEIRSGKVLGDGTEAAIALRKRLNETVDQLDALKKTHTELEVQFESQSKELTIAKSDLNLVNKDQLEILASLRESMNEEKAGLESEMSQLLDQIKELSEKNKMQLEQINGLLMEKVTLQSEGIGQREKMLERERNFSDLRASINSKDIPEDIKGRLLALHEENVQLKEQLASTQTRLTKAKAFIKSQDKLFKAEHSRSNAGSPGIFEEGESFRSQVKVLEDEVERYKKQLRDLSARYCKEFELILGLIHNMGLERTHDHLGKQQRGGPNSWLGQQRKQFGHRLRH